MASPATPPVGVCHAFLTLGQVHRVTKRYRKQKRKHQISHNEGTPRGTFRKGDRIVWCDEGTLHLGDANCFLEVSFCGGSSSVFVCYGFQFTFVSAALWSISRKLPKLIRSDAFVAAVPVQVDGDIIRAVLPTVM